tara:strand:- start:788 stop:1399 length:612 start_codon:yes stop_codon:yes gene_type:complete
MQDNILMADWCKVFTRYYESVDVSYQKPEEEMYTIMSQYVSDVLAREPNLMYQHEFIRESSIWLSKENVEKLFGPYRQRLLSDDEHSFALRAVIENPQVIDTFDITSSSYYDELCKVAVKERWRLLTVVDRNKYSDMLTLCELALDSAYNEALERQHRNKPNKFIIKHMISKLLPIALESNMSTERYSEWQCKLNSVQRKRAP